MPRIVVLTPIPFTHHHIEFFRWMIVVGVLDFRRKKRHADNDIRSLLKSVGTNNECIGVTAHEIWQGRFLALVPREIAGNRLQAIGQLADLGGPDCALRIAKGS